MNTPLEIMNFSLSIALEETNELMEENALLEKKLAWRAEALEGLKEENARLNALLKSDGNWWAKLDKEAA